MKKGLSVLLLSVLLSGQAGILFASGDGTVMIQGFHWTSWRSAPWWGEVGRRSRELSAAGINLAWLPPSSDSLSPEGYLPRKLSLQDSSYGTAAQLGAAVKSLHAAGIKVIADVVLNHRVGSSDWADFTLPAWGADSVCSDDEWGKGKGSPDTGKGFHAARDIDHTKPYVRESLKAWLNGLRDSTGYDGWRYDYARGLAPRFLLEYNRATAPSFAVAEIWDDLDVNNADAHRQALTDWMDAVNGEIKVFDFTTKGVLQQALLSGELWRLADKDGRPAGLLGWWPANAVTFLDNHDTGPSPEGKLQDKGWPFPSNKVMAGYAYLLTHPGVPCIYWPHFFDWGLKGEISKLIAIRRAAGLGSTSPVSIARAEQGLYAAFIDTKVALKLGDRAWSPGAGWTLAASGAGYMVWTR
ncbi:MAG: alpha-amylase [Elusimicrobia bacterium GWA2_62_23]|nr:MAG: alpha-amylase [Elusimicrobia bacterium GWA2_62_23]